MSRSRAVFALASLLLLCGGPAACRQQEPSEAPRAETSEPQTPYLTRRADHETKLRERGPAPARFGEHTPPAGARLVHYPSGELELAAWYAAPEPGPSPAPALIYFHGDFAFGADDFELVEPLVAQGYAVMTPMLRGENGNPGDFELLWGEVDDARAAVEWLASQPEVDPDRVHAFGHSIGGGVAAMLSLYPELPLRMTGSCGGIYVPETFGRWAKSERNAKLVRFDPSDARETSLRVLGPNLQWMAHPHVAYIGEEDRWFIDNAKALEQRAVELGKPFERVMVAGGHMSALPNCLDAYVERMSNPG